MNLSRARWAVVRAAQAVIDNAVVTAEGVTIDVATFEALQAEMAALRDEQRVERQRTKPT